MSILHRLSIASALFAAASSCSFALPPKAPTATLTPVNFQEAGQAEVRAAQEPRRPKRDPRFRGWDYLVTRLRKDGITDRELNAIYQSSRMPKMGEVPFSIHPREPAEMYRHFYREKNLTLAKTFLMSNRRAFKGAEQRFGVARYIVASLLLIETHYGKLTGRELVINRLSRIASTGDPDNLEFNYYDQLRKGEKVSMAQVVDRARLLEQTFYPEILALFTIARREHVNLFNVKGSIAGAFGMPQFLPSSYLRFAVDGNRDGRVSLFNESDAIFSIANFLQHFGWKDSLSRSAKAEVLFHYNHSDAYVTTALDLADYLHRSK